MAGEKAGHPFRGNQYVDVAGGGGLWDQLPRPVLDTAIVDENGNPKPADWEAKHSYEVWLGSSERDMLEHYVNFGAYDLNRGLRSKQDWERKAAEGSARYIDRIIAKSPELPRDVTVYRGIKSGMDEGRLYDLKGNKLPGGKPMKDILTRVFGTTDVVGKEFTEPAFVSATTDKRIAWRFADKHDSGIVLEIKAKRGARVFKGRGDESELIFGRGHRFRVTGIRDLPRPNDRGIMQPTRLVTVEMIS